MPDAKKVEATSKPVDFSHPSVGGKRVGQHVAETPAKPISFEHLGGKRVGGHIAQPATPEEPAESTDQDESGEKSV